MKEQRTTAIQTIRHVTQPQAKSNIRRLPTWRSRGSDGTDCFFFSFTYLFDCTGVLVGTLSIFSCGMWDLVPWLGIEPRFPASPFVWLWGCCLDSQFRRGTKWNRNSSSFSPMHQTNTFRMEQRRILSPIKGINCPWHSWGKKIKLIEWCCCCYC